MTPKAIPSKPVLDRVTLRLSHQAGPGEASGWRRRVSRALDRVSLEPSQPTQAILVVRRLVDPQPGALLGNDPERSFRAWERAAQARLADCWRGARRPALETVPPWAEGVWFADAAEWLACLSWDLHQGLATGRWWWQSWLCSRRYSSVADALIQFWAAEARFLPHSLALLHQQYGAQLEPLLARLTSVQAARVRRAVSEAYQLPDLSAQAVVERLNPLLPEPAQATARPLTVETQSLTMLCLALSETPNALSRLSHWAVTKSAAPSLTQVEGGVEPAAVERAHDQAQVPPELGSTAALLAEQTQTPRLAGLAETLSELANLARTPPKLLPEAHPPPLTGEPASTARPEPAEPHPSSHTVGPAELDLSGGRSESQTALLRPEPPAHRPVLTADTGLQTAAGGLWYLVNVLAGLDWLDDDDLNGWRRLSFLAQALLPEPLPDPVWALLASQAGDKVSADRVRRWLERALPQVTGYLTEQLERPETFGEAIRESATLFLTRTHVDIVFSLDQIWLDLRQAGLDRDPGWTPQLARVIAFHYE